MALDELVGYAQDNFADLDGPPWHGRQREPARPRQPPWLIEIEAEGPALSRQPKGEVPLIDIPGGGFDGSSVRVPDPSKGPDSLAYYRPFHFHEQLWGIFIWEEGLFYLATVLKGSRILPGDETFVTRAWKLLFEHELLHFTVEIACTRAELIARSRLYIPYFLDEAAAIREEALANARAFREAVDGAARPISKAARSWMKSQGAGYRDFEELLDNPAYERERLESVGRFLKPLHIDYSPDRLGPASFVYNRATQLRVPVYVVSKYGRRLTGRGRPFPKDEGMRIKVHTNEHRPPHYHIFIPPNEEKTRYQWPDHKPLGDDPPLSTSEKKKLKRYWQRHGEKIEKKLKKVFGGRS